MKMFAASGSCSDEELEIVGKVNGITFISEEFTGTMDSQLFWDKLSEFARNKGKFVKLMY